VEREAIACFFAAGAEKKMMAKIRKKAQKRQTTGVLRRKFPQNCEGDPRSLKDRDEEDWKDCATRTGTGTVPGLAGEGACATFKGRCSFFIEGDFLKKWLGRKTYGKYFGGSHYWAMESD